MRSCLMLSSGYWRRWLDMYKWLRLPTCQIHVHMFIIEHFRKGLSVLPLSFSYDLALRQKLAWMITISQLIHERSANNAEENFSTILQ